MKLSITLNRIFGNNVDEWNDINEDDEVLEYFAIYHNNEDNDCEPDYFLRYFTDGTYKLNDLRGNVLHSGDDLAVLKKVLKKLPKAS